MQGGFGRGASGATARDACRLALRGLLIVVAASLVSACNHDGGPSASLTGAPGGTLAFESIDGPPLSVFNKLVENLAAAADARQVAVVSRAGPAQYRIRGYLAAHVEKKQTTIAWVWDVYDTAQKRALRIAGEEQVPGRRTVRDGWTAADEKVLRKIAQASINNLAAFVGPAPAAAPAPSGGPSSSGTAVAAAAADPPSATRTAFAAQ